MGKLNYHFKKKLILDIIQSIITKKLNYHFKKKLILDIIQSIITKKRNKYDLST